MTTAVVYNRKIRDFTFTFGFNNNYYGPNIASLKANPLLFNSVRISMAKLIDNGAMQPVSNEIIPTAFNDIKFMESGPMTMASWRPGTGYQSHPYTRSDPAFRLKMMKILYKEINYQKQKNLKHKENMGKQIRKYKVCPIMHLPLNFKSKTKQYTH